MWEKKILSTIKHPNIVDLIGTFQDDESLYFILEYAMYGDLCGLIKAYSKSNSSLEHLPIPMARFYTAEIINALDHLHANGIVHWDLKPQNILITDSLHCKIIDFGDSLVEGAKESHEDKSEEDKTTKAEEGFVEFKPTDDSDEDEGYSPGKEYRGTFVGTPLYVAPEMLKKTVSGHFTDIWALGIILFEMVTGDCPFRG